MVLIFPLHLLTMVSFKHALANPLASTWLFKTFFPEKKKKRKRKLLKIYKEKVKENVETLLNNKNLEK